MRNTIGYLLGFLVFIAGIPALMWWVSGRPFPWAPALLWDVIALVLALPRLPAEGPALPVEMMCQGGPPIHENAPFPWTERPKLNRKL